MSLLNAFKLKPFDLEPVFKDWPDGPRFIGNPKKDLPLEAWFEQIKKGCVERRVPEEYWHKVAQHFMGEKAKARLDELKVVIARVHGGKYRWNWKKFKVAMRNMSWEIDASKTETIKVGGKGSSRWWITRRTSSTTESIDVPKARKDSSAVTVRPSRSNTISHPFTAKNKPTPQPPTRSQTMNVPESGAATEIKAAPTWLLNAYNALEYLTSEHPKVMSTISAILITVGSIPAIPAISAGAGGALLASGTAHAVGAIAVGVGSLMQSAQVVNEARSAARAAPK